MFQTACMVISKQSGARVCRRLQAAWHLVQQECVAAMACAAARICSCHCPVGTGKQQWAGQAATCSLGIWVEKPSASACLDARSDSALRVSCGLERLSGGSGWRGSLYPFTSPAPARSRPAAHAQPGHGRQRG